MIKECNGKRDSWANVAACGRKDANHPAHVFTSEPTMIGKRVQTHAATDAWIRGDRYGTIVGIGKAREYVDRETKAHSMVRPYRVKLDVSGRILRFHPDHVFLID